MAQVNFTTPVGRFIRGSMYTPRDKDAEGKPLLIKSGPNAGQPRVDYYFEVAIPKGPEQHWSQTEWGKTIWTVGHQSFPQGQGQLPTFAWKIYDGDSQVPNKAGKKPCDFEGARGCWVIRFSSGYAPKLFNSNGTAPIVEPNAIKPGYYVQVNGNVDGNNSMQQPGVFISHSMVALSGYGPEIITGPDPTAAGFGAAPLPAGASATPLGAMPGTPTPAGYAPAPGVGVPPAMPAPAPVPAIGVPSASPSNVPAPNPAFLGVPPVAMPTVPGVPDVPATPVPQVPARRMTPAANGATYEQLIANGWSDQLLIQHGLMVM